MTLNTFCLKYIIVFSFYLDLIISSKFDAMESIRVRTKRSLNQIKDEWHLVNFIQDGIWFVCSSKRMKKDNKGSWWCKWPSDGKWYEAVIIDSGDKKSMMSAKILKESFSTISTPLRPTSSSVTCNLNMQLNELTPNMNIQSIQRCNESKTFENISALPLPSISQLSLTEFDLSIIRKIPNEELEVYELEKNPNLTELAVTSTPAYDKSPILEDPMTTFSSETALQDNIKRHSDTNFESDVLSMFEPDSDEYQPNLSDISSDSNESIKHNVSLKKKNKFEALFVDEINKSSSAITEDNAEDNAVFLPTVSVSTITEKKGEKRKWDKTFYCIYCKKYFKKLPRHWYTCHENETAVAKILSLNKKSIERNRLIAALQNRAVFIQNSETIKSGEGIIVPKRRTRIEDLKPLKNYLPCEYCNQLLSKYYLARHQRKCSFKVEKGTKRINRNIRALSMLMMPVGPTISARFKDNILAKMSGDDIFAAVRYDQLILMFGEAEFNRLGHDSRYYRTIIDRIRELGRLLLGSKELNPNITKLKQLIDAKQYQLFKSSVKKVAGFDEVTNTFQSPSLALKIGITIKKCVYILKGDYLEDSLLREEIPKLDAFLSILETKWTREIGSHAYRTLSERKWNNSKTIPFAKDIQILNKYLAEENKKLYELLNENTDIQIFSKLCETTLVSIIILNRRRVGEVQYMLLSEYGKAHGANTDSDVYSTLTDVEKELSKTLVLLTIKGKKGRGVPIILTKRLQNNIQLLNSKREECGVNNTNKYLFPSLKTDSGHFIAHKLLNKYSKIAGCSAPETITSTRLRKHIAVMSQLLNLKDNELDSLAQFMGHDIRVHREYYRLSDETIQLAKLSKLLINMENGNIGSMKGKSLSEITISEDIEDIDIDRQDSENEDLEVLNDIQNIQNGEPSTSNNILHKSKNAKKNIFKKKIMGKRTKWTEKEIQITLEYFSNHLASCSMPGKKEFVKFLDQKGTEMQNRTWTQIKDFIVRKIKARK